jgi:hypothetical protein
LALFAVRFASDLDELLDFEKALAILKPPLVICKKNAMIICERM